MTRTTTGGACAQRVLAEGEETLGLSQRCVRCVRRLPRDGPLVGGDAPQGGSPWTGAHQGTGGSEAGSTSLRTPRYQDGEALATALREHSGLLYHNSSSDLDFETLIIR